MIENDVLLLRPIESKDAQTVFNYKSDALTNQFQGTLPKSVEEVEEFIGRNPAKFNQSDTWFQLVIILKESGQLVGDIGVHFVGNDGYQCELGITLAKEHHGKGIATEAMKITIKYLFQTLGKHRIFASIDPRNKGVIKLLESLGFRKEAHFKESLFLKGEWVDDVIYGMLNSEWSNRVAS